MSLTLPLESSLMLLLSSHLSSKVIKIFYHSAKLIPCNRSLKTFLHQNSCHYKYIYENTFIITSLIRVNWYDSINLLLRRWGLQTNTVVFCCLFCCLFVVVLVVFFCVVWSQFASSACGSQVATSTWALNSVVGGCCSCYVFLFCVIFVQILCHFWSQFASCACGSQVATSLINIWALNSPGYHAYHISIIWHQWVEIFKHKNLISKKGQIKFKYALYCYLLSNWIKSNSWRKP